MIRVSVIIATYNSEKHLKRLLDSIQNQEGIQDLFELELIAVDDCSSDTTLEILKEHAISYYTTEQNSGGPNKGRNIGLEHCTGDYIFIADHDDEWLPNRIKTQLKYAHLAPIVSCGYHIIEEGAEKRRQVKDKQQADHAVFYPENDTFLDKISKVKNRQTTYLGSLMFHKSLKHIRFEEHFGQIDFDWIAFLFQGQCSVEVSANLYNRYVFGQNLSLNKTYRLRDYYYSLLTLESFVPEYAKAVRKGRKRINGSRARYHYLMKEMKQARHYFKQAELNLKTILFYLSSFIGYNYVIKKFKFFG